MQNDEVIAIGDKVELVRDEGRVFKTMIEDMTGNGFFLAGVPSCSGIPMLIHIGDMLALYFSRESGKYATQMSVAGFEKRGEVRYVWLMQRTRPQIYQRRGAFRLPVDIKVLICEYEMDFENKLRTQENVGETTLLETVGAKDISVTGTALEVRRDYKLSERLVLKPFLEDRSLISQPLVICAVVVRFVPEHHIGRNSVGVQFFGQARSTHELLSKYVLLQQQKQIRQRRFT